MRHTREFLLAAAVTWDAKHGLSGWDWSRAEQGVPSANMQQWSSSGAPASGHHNWSQPPGHYSEPLTPLAIDIEKLSCNNPMVCTTLPHMYCTINSSLRHFLLSPESNSNIFLSFQFRSHEHGNNKRAAA